MGSIQEFSKKMERLSSNLRQMSGNQVLALTEVLAPAFVSNHTRFSNVQELFAASGFTIETAEDFVAIPAEKWDAFIHSVTQFSSH